MTLILLYTARWLTYGLAQAGGWLADRLDDLNGILERAIVRREAGK